MSVCFPFFVSGVGGGKVHCIHCILPLQFPWGMKQKMGDSKDGGSKKWRIQKMDNPKKRVLKKWRIQKMEEPKNGGAKKWRSQKMEDPKN